jgi:NAD(P)-dependent dehydrogenase (short-subunit alcohol dehydrogenase family)
MNRAQVFRQPGGCSSSVTRSIRRGKPRPQPRNNVLPGWIDSLPETEERRKGVPLGRYGKAEEIAATVAFLVSQGAAYITGQNIRVDGGLTRSV